MKHTSDFIGVGTFISVVRMQIPSARSAPGFLCNTIYFHSESNVYVSEEALEVAVRVGVGSGVLTGYYFSGRRASTESRCQGQGRVRFRWS